MPKYTITWKQTTEHSMEVDAQSEQDARVVFQDIYYDPNDDEITFHAIEVEEN